MEHHVSLITRLLDGAGWPVPDEIVMVTLVFLILSLLALVGGRRLRVAHPGGLQQVLEVGIGGFVSLMEDTIPHHARKHLPILGTFALFIFCSNLFGLVPGLQPPTASFSVTLGLALISFTYYNVQGVKAQGPIGYAKHFLGPLLVLAPLMLPIELVSHMARPVSLSLRLLGNIAADHKVVSAFFILVPLFLPIPFLILGALVVIVQTLVFCLLTMVYIQGAVAHEEH